MKRNTSLGQYAALLLATILLLLSIGTFASLDLTVLDAGGGADDVAHVILFYPDASQDDLGYTPQGNINGRTWNLLADSRILTKGAGTYTLRIIHDKDTDAVCENSSNEVLGTYTITFGGGIALSTVDDNGTADAGASTTIAVLENDLLVDASSFAFGTIPCPLTTPSIGCNCSTYDPAGPPYQVTKPDVTAPCPSSLKNNINYVQGLFYVTVGDTSLGISSVGHPLHGTASIIGSDVRYTPDPGFCGTDTFTYTAVRSGETDTGTVTVSVSAAPPTPQGDLATTPEGVAIVIDVLSNDSAAGGSALTLDSVGNPSYGTVTIVGNRIRYTPQARFEGNDRFSYRARNVCGATATGWVDVSVLHTNHPPEANAGIMYRGVVGDAVLLNASFSHDPDIEDTLQYRWDLDGNGVADTGWSNSPQYAAIFSEPFFGRITLEVRDLYRGIPSGEISEATALVRIASLQSIQVFVFEDLDENGIMDSGEPGFPGISVTIAGEQLTTEADGGISIELDAGSWDIALTAQSISQLEGRGFAVLEAETTVDLGTGATVTVGLGIVKTLTNFKGFVYVDLDENGEFNQDTDQLLQGLRVVLDEEQETLTDDGGRYFFLSIPFGEHILWVGENADKTGNADSESILSLSVPVILERGASNEFAILWPWIPAGPGKGFLRVDVEKSQGN